MNVTEARWMAYVDGELDAREAALVEAAMQADPELAARVEAQRRLRARLRRECAAVLDEPVPARLRATLGQTRRAAATPVWLAAAASLVVGVLAATWWQAATPPALQLADGTIAARGELAAALDDRLASDPVRDGIGVGLSFRSRDGDYCRSFELDAQALAGLACRRADGWHVVALGAADTQGDGLRQAASPFPPAVLAEVDARIEGEPLDASGERRARAAGWR